MHHADTHLHRFDRHQSRYLGNHLHFPGVARLQGSPGLAPFYVPGVPGDGVALFRVVLFALGSFWSVLDQGAPGNCMISVFTQPPTKLLVNYIRSAESKTFSTQYLHRNRNPILLKVEHQLTTQHCTCILFTRLTFNST